MLGKIKDNILIYLSFFSLFISIISFFLPVINYQFEDVIGYKIRFHGYDFFIDDNRKIFEKYIMNREYIGPIYWDINEKTIYIFALFGVLSIIISFVGVALISKQKDNTISFILTLIGFIGTISPAILIIVCVLFLHNNFKGEISCGIYTVVAPIAMLICLYAATKAHFKNMKMKRYKRDAKGLIFYGGDL